MRATILNLLTTFAFLGLGESTPLAALDKRYTLDSNGVKYKVFEHAATGATTKIVSNSGICETTPGVNQHSGYFSVANQYKDYIDYAANNTYKKLITPKQYSTYVSTYQKNNLRRDFDNNTVNGQGCIFI
ncbi:hypothetical protein HYQ45_018900 [Verticillium longisporum]|uniref:Uncharacterized protein n=1 Tax=Verticillium longisporum TaxID=100787 RepID=A0A8I3AQN1_VERLO|nr:hypothetical protein HYQ45_018900 [Verticillium longisporum]